MHTNIDYIRVLIMLMLLEEGRVGRDGAFRVFSPSTHRC